MKHVIISAAETVPPRWKAAFPDAEVVETVLDLMSSDEKSDIVCWLDATLLGAEATGNSLKGLQSAGFRVVVMSPQPSDREAFSMLSQGARGYCHVQAAPEQLLNVASAVCSGGYWMPPHLVQLLVNQAIKFDKSEPRQTLAGLDELTEREREVADAVGEGFSNKEIAELLGVAERTVKAHLTSIFEKLGIRDRVHLALAISRLQGV